MMRLRAWMPVAFASAVGCVSGAALTEPAEPPPTPAIPLAAPRPTVTDTKPPPPLLPAIADTATAPLELAEVLSALERNFPLIDAAEQERAIAAGLRLTALSAFDTTLRATGTHRDGSFPNDTLITGVEQPVAFRGMNVFANYRFGYGDFPVYNGGLKTATGGEFRAGVLLPLWRDAAIDRRRTAVRQAQIGVALADPAVARVRIDAYRAARRAYVNWLAAGEFCAVAERFTQVARERATRIEARFKGGQAPELDDAQARQAVAEREGRLAMAQQRWQQAMIDLSLLFRNEAGQPLLAPAARLPQAITALAAPTVDAKHLATDIEAALALRPELVRFQLLRERATLDLKLAENQLLPGLNLGLAASQDVGPSSSKPPNTGIFASDRTTAEAFLAFDVPLQRRDARGRAFAAMGVLNQLSQQERFARDSVSADVQAAYAVLIRDYDRLAAARRERDHADVVVRITRDNFEGGLTRLFELNALEVAALDTHAKLVDIAADYFRAQADYRAALGLAND
jgi:outer membrane protein TolC